VTLLLKGVYAIPWLPPLAQQQQHYATRRLGWAYAQQQPVAVDEFEQRRARRVQSDLVLTRQSREELLVEWGASFQDIIESIRVNIRIKNQRRSTVNAIGRYDRWEEMMENAGRKIKKTIGLQKQVVPEESPEFQQYQQHQQRSESPQRQVSVPKKPVRTVSADSPQGGASGHGRHVSRELLETVAQVPIFDDFGDEVDQEKAPSLIGSSLVDSEISHADGPERPGISAEVSRLSFDSKRPTALIELDQMDALADDDGNGSVYSAHSGITMSEHGGHYSAAGESCSTDGFGELERDTSLWAVGGMDCPILLRRYHPTVICEDGTYDDVAPSRDNWQFQGFGMQPPPFSNAMVSRWK
jgi:hypothetical protein